jgi:DNA-binding NtrC family response regulator
MIQPHHLYLKTESHPLHLFSLPLQEARAHFEYDYLKFQLASSEGSISRAALSVGMERTALHRKLKNLEERLFSKAPLEETYQTKEGLSPTG